MSCTLINRWCAGVKEKGSLTVVLGLEWNRAQAKWSRA
jgi:hypothetical protein